MNVKKREIKLKESSSVPTIEIEFKLRQTNGWEVYNESGESEVLSNTDVLSLSIHKLICYNLWECRYQHQILNSGTWIMAQNGTMTWSMLHTHHGSP